MRVQWIFVVIFGAFFFNQSHATSVVDVNVFAHSDTGYELHIHFSDSDMPNYSLAYLPNPERLILDLHDVKYASVNTETTGGSDVYQRLLHKSFSFKGVTGLRGSVQPDGDFRLVLDSTLPMLFYCSSTALTKGGNVVVWRFGPNFNQDSAQPYRMPAVPECEVMVKTVSSPDQATPSYDKTDTLNLVKAAGNLQNDIKIDNIDPDSKTFFSKHLNPIGRTSLLQASDNRYELRLLVPEGQLPEYSAAYLTNPDRLVLDLSYRNVISNTGTQSDAIPVVNRPLSQTLSLPGFLKIRGAHHVSGTYRLVLDTTSPMKFLCSDKIVSSGEQFLRWQFGPVGSKVPADHRQALLPGCGQGHLSHPDKQSDSASETPAIKTSKSNPYDTVSSIGNMPSAATTIVASSAPGNNSEPAYGAGLADGLEFDLDAILGHSGLSHRQVESLLDHGVSDGKYLLDISINDRGIGRDWVKIQSGHLCFSTSALLSRYIYQEELKLRDDCYELPETQSVQQLDVNRQQLNIVLSEHYLKSSSNDFQQGGTGLALNYNLNYRQSRVNNSSMSGRSELKGFYNNWIMQSQQSYFDDSFIFHDMFVRRDFVDFGLRFHAGRIGSAGFSIDGFRYDGIRLESNNLQIRGAMQGRIEGSTIGPATISISQNGTKIYQSMVPGGEYVLSNFKLRNTTSPLTVMETFDDGTSKTFEVPAQLAMPQRFFQPTTGVPSYYLSLGVTPMTNNAFVMAGGRVDSINSSWQPAADLVVFDDKIINAGFQLSQRSNQSFQWDLRSRFSFASQPGIPTFGNQFDLNASWSEPLFSLSSGIRYSSRYFVNPLQQTDQASQELGLEESLNALSTLFPEQPSRYSANISASYSLPPVLNSRLNLSWFWQEMYNDESSQSVSLSWSGNYENVSFMAGYTKQLNSDESYQFFADMRIPFGQGSTRSNVIQRYNESATRQNYSARLSSRFGNNNYSLGYNKDLFSSQEGYSASLNTTTPLANVSASYSRLGSYDSISASGSGSIVVTPKALAIGPERANDTLVLVSSRDIDSKELINSVPIQGQRTRSLLPYRLVNGSNAYRSRHISVDQSALSASQQLVYGRSEVKPMAGTVLHEEFLIRQVSRFLINLTVNGEQVPALSHLFREDGDLIGVTDHLGQIFISDNRIRHHRYYLELTDGSECLMQIDWSSVRTSGNEYFQIGDAICEPL